MDADPVYGNGRVSTQQRMRYWAAVQYCRMMITTEIDDCTATEEYMNTRVGDGDERVDVKRGRMQIAINTVETCFLRHRQPPKRSFHIYLPSVDTSVWPSSYLLQDARSFLCMLLSPKRRGRRG